MNFLNEATGRYPDAISFAPGRPAEEHFAVRDAIDAVDTWVRREEAERGESPEAVFRRLGQYGATGGLIRDLVAKQLERDEGIRAPPESILVTCGAQEAMAIVAVGLFDPRRDVLLTSDPAYIGITGLARILDLPVEPVPTGELGLEVSRIRAAIERIRSAGMRPRALYDVPDFNNPQGTSLPMATRRELLQLAEDEDLLILEDNPYGMFAYDGEPAPTLKSLDEHHRVVYLGTFSKTLFPGLRLGYLVADQPVVDNDRPSLLAEALSRVKSLVTVNTSPLLQAMAGGLLLEHGGSLRARVAESLPYYRANRDRMLAALDDAFGDSRPAKGISWNRPAGGFFLTVRLPFAFGAEELEACARDFGVLCCPLSIFSIAGRGRDQIRLSFSYVTPEDIDEGIRRLAGFVADRLSQGAEG
jgi:(S)-3,5-dihydroxyphenylglycine transaminase